MITLSNPRDPVVLGAGGRWRPKEKNTIFCTTPKSDSLLVGHLIRWPSESDKYYIWPEDWQAGETLCIFGIGASADKTDKATGLEQCSIGVARPVLHRRSACAFLLPPSLSSQNWALRRPAAGAARSFSRQIKQQLHEEEPAALQPTSAPSFLPPTSETNTTTRDYHQFNQVHQYQHQHQAISNQFMFVSDDTSWHCMLDGSQFYATWKFAIFLFIVNSIEKIHRINSNVVT